MQRHPAYAAPRPALTRADVARAALDPESAEDRRVLRDMMLDLGKDDLAEAVGDGLWVRWRVSHRRRQTGRGVRPQTSVVLAATEAAAIAIIAAACDTCGRPVTAVPF